MKTREKHAFIDKKDDILTIHQFRPNIDKVKEFRENELSLIKKNDLVYLASAYEYGDCDYLSLKNLTEYDYDFFSRIRLGFEKPDDHIFKPHYIKNGDIITHTFKKESEYGHKECKDLVDLYTKGRMNQIPFRCDIPIKKDVKENQYFLPLDVGYWHNPVHSKKGYKDLHVLHITYHAYLEQLLRNNRIDSLKLNIETRNGNLERILDLFDFEEPVVLNINSVIEAENLIKSSNQMLYADKIFDSSNGYNHSQKENTPISADLLEQAKIDEPIIEDVKSYLLSKK